MKMAAEIAHKTAQLRSHLYQLMTIQIRLNELDLSELVSLTKELTA